MIPNKSTIPLALEVRKAQKHRPPMRFSPKLDVMVLPKVLENSLFPVVFGENQGRLLRYPLYQSNRPYMFFVDKKDAPKMFSIGL